MAIRKLLAATLVTGAAAASIGLMGCGFYPSPESPMLDTKAECREWYAGEHRKADNDFALFEQRLLREQKELLAEYADKTLTYDDYQTLNNAVAKALDEVVEYRDTHLWRLDAELTQCYDKVDIGKESQENDNL